MPIICGGSKCIDIMMDIPTQEVRYSKAEKNTK
jgi:hypothetical protein